MLDESGNGLEATLQRVGEDRAQFDFAIQKYTAKQLDETSHSCDLEDNEFVVFMVDARHRGLGTGSCGPGALERYDLECNAEEFTVELKPIRGQSTVPGTGYYAR